MMVKQDGGTAGSTCSPSDRIRGHAAPCAELNIVFHLRGPGWTPAPS
jgi:hypothetical protein